MEINKEIIVCGHHHNVAKDEDAYAVQISETETVDICCSCFANADRDIIKDGCSKKYFNETPFITHLSDVWFEGSEDVDNAKQELKDYLHELSIEVTAKTLMENKEDYAEDIQMYLEIFFKQNPSFIKDWDKWFNNVPSEEI